MDYQLVADCTKLTFTDLDIKLRLKISVWLPPHISKRVHVMKKVIVGCWRITICISNAIAQAFKATYHQISR